MDSRRKRFVVRHTIIFACAYLLPVAGCGSSDPKADLPPAQADAATKLEAAGAALRINDGKVTYVDFASARDVSGAIVHLKVLPDIETLNFNGPNAGDAELAQLTGLSELKKLALTGTSVTDKGLAHLSGLSKLEILTLNNCNISDEGLVHLKDLKSLRQLHLNETKVSDAGLEHLTGLEGLEALLVYDTAVTTEAAVAFREQHPDTMVVTSEGEVGASDESDGP